MPGLPQLLGTTYSVLRGPVPESPAGPSAEANGTWPTLVARQDRSRRERKQACRPSTAEEVEKPPPPPPSGSKRQRGPGAAAEEAEEEADDAAQDEEEGTVASANRPAEVRSPLTDHLPRAPCAQPSLHTSRC